MMKRPAIERTLAWSRRSGSLAVVLALVGADLGCSHLRARRQATGTAATPAGAELAPAATAKAEGDGAALAADPLAAADRPAAAASPGLASARLAPASAAAAAAGAAPESAEGAGVTLLPPVPIAAKPAAPRVVPAAAPARPRAKPAPTPAQVIGQARAALDAMGTYQLALRRQERVNGELLPVEDLEMAIRRAPLAARLTWTDGPSRGREVLYRADEPGGQMHVNMPNSKLPITRLNLPPDSPLVMKNSRHPITEAGLDPIVASLEEADRAGTLKSMGLQAPPPLDRPHLGLVRRAENGDAWHAYFDPDTHLPALVECHAANGDLVESYLFRAIRADPAELATVAAFDPDARWGPPRGLFGRTAARNPDAAAATR